MTEFHAAAKRVASIVIRELFLESSSSAIPKSCDTPVRTYTVGGLVVFLAHDTTGMFCGNDGIAKHEVRTRAVVIQRGLPCVATVCLHVACAV